MARKAIEDTDTVVEEPSVTELPLDIIRTDGGTQPRAGINKDTVGEYIQALKGGKKKATRFPPVEVVFDGSTYYLWDGFHRHAAHVGAKKRTINAVVTQGTREDAVWLSYRANATNGLQRTPDDKRRAVVGALQHTKSADLSDAQIADHCGVDRSTVSKWRKTLLEQGTVLPSAIRTNGTPPPAPPHPPSATNGTSEEPEPVAMDGSDGLPLPVSADAETEGGDGSDGLPLPVSADAETEGGDGSDGLPLPVSADAETEELAPDLQESGWRVTHYPDGTMQGFHDEWSMQTEPSAVLTDIEAQMRMLLDTLSGTEPRTEPETDGDLRGNGTGDMPDETAIPIVPRTDTERLALRVNLAGVLYQLVTEEWESHAPNTDAWSAVPFAYASLRVHAEQLLHGPLTEAADRIPASTA